jgi:hypothetical protein
MAALFLLIFVFRGMEYGFPEKLSFRGDLKFDFER